MKTSRADKYFSLYIRLRDTQDDGYCRCITCGKIQEPKRADCGHWIKRQHQATRFSEMNAAAQCGKCNRLEQGRDVIFRQKLVEKYGEDKITLLEALSRNPFKRTQTDLDYLAVYFKQKATELSRIKGIALWVLLIFMAVACQKPPEAYCWDCTYHDDKYTFCDMTERQIDSLQATFTGCERDSLKCTKLNLYIQ